MNTFMHFEPRGLTGQHERRQDYAAVQPGERVAAIHPLFDPNFVYDGSFLHTA